MTMNFIKLHNWDYIDPKAKNMYYAYISGFKSGHVYLWRKKIIEQMLFRQGMPGNYEKMYKIPEYGEVS